MSLVSSCRARGSGSKLYQGRFRLAIRKYFFIARILTHVSSLPRAVVKSPSLGVFKQCADLMLKDIVQCLSFSAGLDL